MENIYYKTSRDMKRLKELLDQGYNVVCFITVDMVKSDKKITTVCVAKYYEAGEYSFYIFCCAGTVFIQYWTHGIDYKYTFEELLETRDIQFIEPTIIKED